MYNNIQSITPQTLTAIQWKTFWWTDFDQRTLRYLPGSSIERGISTMEMESMEQTRVQVYRIHQYEDKEGIYRDHLAIVKSRCVFWIYLIISWM